MQVAEYEKGLLVAACWQLAKSNDVNELLSIACVIRNWVVTRFNAVRLPMNGKIYFKSYSEAIANFSTVYPFRDLPAVNESALIDPTDGMLVKIDGVYDCSLIDMTSSKAFPFGARYFGRSANPSTWFLQEVLQQQEVHPLIGQFGSQAFHA